MYGYVSLVLKFEEEIAQDLKEKLFLNFTKTHFSPHKKGTPKRQNASAIN